MLTRRGHDFSSGLQYLPMMWVSIFYECIVSSACPSSPDADGTSKNVDCVEKVICLLGRVRGREMLQTTREALGRFTCGSGVTTR